MKTSILFLISALITPSAFAKSKCMTNAIGIYHETGFGISFGGGSSSVDYGEKSVVNVPLSVDNKPACFIKQNAFKLKSEAKKDKDEKNSITVTPMKTEFENVPNASQKQYIFVEKDAENSLKTKFHIMSFICAGELPLSIEATSDTYSKLALTSNSANIKVSKVFATGKAAQNLKKVMPDLSVQETFDFFGKIYQEKTHKELMADKPCCTEYRIPSIISDTSITSLSGVERAIASSFTTMGANVPNGCSKDFADSMKNYQLENYTANESLKDYQIKKKWFSDDLVFEW
ncbi:hypothetical protein SHI21_11880 [Bacteriovorax sp. PP10]|uniref:Uncharacterized protein n=1 Tax=Bacteriovorax antarcticus TaxID=3088717 RepID=A0ABU5VV41_9BACT|nr:hypothetical protein [Bacteriovorax sp. PP10]MEA9356913.1 hypothetical protein [Bacteriovorax sp. PP10]